MAAKIIRQSVTFKASPHAVYEAIIDSKRHADFTGSKVEMSRKVGGKFSVWDGEITGENLELDPDKKIVQSWRLSDWAKGHFSKVTFAFEAAADGSTRLRFTHSGVPEDAYEDVKQGWYDYYWTPMKEMLEK